MATKNNTKIRFEKRYEELFKESDGFEDDRDAYIEKNIFFVSEEARWKQYILQK